jgi:hypothetical protein
VGDDPRSFALAAGGPRRFGCEWHVS